MSLILVLATQINKTLVSHRSNITRLNETTAEHFCLHWLLFADVILLDKQLFLKVQMIQNTDYLLMFN